MNHTPHNQDARQRRRRIAAMIVLLPLVLLVAGRFWLHVQERAAMRAVSEAGHPVTIEQLRAWYGNPPQPNAADVYQRAFDAIDLENELAERVPGFNRTREMPPRGHWFDDDTADAARQLLERNARAIELIHEATAIEDCQFAIDFSQGVDLDLPHLGYLRQAARLLRLEAELAARDGRTEQAIQTTLEMFHLSDALRDEPLIISQLVRLSLDATAVDTLERIMCERDMSDAQLAPIDQAIARRDIEDAYVRALIGERCLALTEARGPWTHPALDAAGIFILDKLTFMQLMEDAIAEAQRRADASTSDLRIPAGEIPDYAVFTNTMLPALNATGRTFTHYVAILRCARAGMAIKRYRTAHDRLPASLDELVPDYLDSVPRDPFVSEPLHYARRNGGAVVWSVGKDEHDDGGTPRSNANDRSRENTDVTFTIDLPEPPPPEDETEDASP